MSGFFREVLENFATSTMEDSGEPDFEQYCPYFLDAEAISAVKFAMLGVRFQPGVSNSTEYSEETINLAPVAWSGVLFEVYFNLANTRGRMNVTLDGENWNSLMVYEDASFLADRSMEGKLATSHLFMLGDEVSGTPASMSSIKYGSLVYAHWFEYFGMAMGKALLELGNRAMYEDRVNYRPTLQATWDWLANALSYSEVAAG